MSIKSDKNLMVGLDIGTSKIVALIGKKTSDNQIEIVGLGSHPSRGLKKGVVVNIDAAVHSIQRALEEAELSAGCQIYSVYTGIAGSHIRSLNSHGIVAIRDREVTQADVDRVIDAARAVAIPADEKILHILPQEFIIDHQDGIWDPIGMAGVRLEARAHLVIGAVSATQNIVKCVERCGLNVASIILEQLASSHAVLTEDEKELGVCLIDIGGGTTDIAVFAKGAIAHTAVIPIAGDQVTSDIAIALHTPTQSAEALKLKYGCSTVDSVKEGHIFKVKGFGDQPDSPITQKDLALVIGPRYEELFALVQAELKRAGFADRIAAGIVLTGGASKVQGAVSLAESVFNMPVRLGSPQRVHGVSEVSGNPIYATAVGLLLYGEKQQQYQISSYNSVGVLTRMRQWFQANF
jgi:cell division protein FtsA